jgi:hypothetical protein
LIDLFSMAYRFKANAPVEANVHRILNEQLDKAQHQLSDKFVRKPASAIHDARKRLKKGRSVLRLIRRSLKKDTYKQEKDALKYVGKQLASARDGEAYQETLNMVLEHHAQVINVNVFSDVQVALREYHQAKLHMLMDSDEPMMTVRSSLKDSSIRLRQLSLQASGWDALDQGLERIYYQGKKRFKVAYEEGTDSAFHEWRKRVKDLWYDTRLLRSTWPSVMNAFETEAHQLSKILGDDHDIAELRQFLLNCDRAIAPGVALDVLFPLMNDFQEQLRQQAYDLGGRLYAEEPSAFVHRIGNYWHMRFEV